MELISHYVNLRKIASEKGTTFANALSQALLDKGTKKAIADMHLILDKSERDVNGHNFKKKEILKDPEISN